MIRSAIPAIKGGGPEEIEESVNAIAFKRRMIEQAGGAFCAVQSNWHSLANAASPYGSLRCSSVCGIKKARNACLFRPRSGCGLIGGFYFIWGRKVTSGGTRPNEGASIDLSY